MDEKIKKQRTRRWLTPFSVVAVIACVALLCLMVFPPYLSFKDLAQERALEIAFSEARARLNTKFASELMSGATCEEARAGLGDVRTFADPHSSAHLGNLWVIRKIECADPMRCTLYLEGAYEDVEGLEVSVTVPLPACPDAGNPAQ